MPSLHDITKSLDAKKVGSSWMALCPCHRDTNRSLAIREHDGRLLVHCHAGCLQREVIAALRARRLWPQAQPAPRSAKDDRGPIVAEYLYRDEHGKVLYRITRHLPKNFLAWRLDGAGGWRPGLSGVRRVPYNLPELIANEIVFVVEGEKDCDTLGAHGFVATTNAFGAEQKWDRTFDAFFAGKTVICLPDNDKSGLVHMADVARGLLKHLSALYWHELEGVKDISDWFAVGHSEVELCERLEVLFGKP